MIMYQEKAYVKEILLSNEVTDKMRQILPNEVYLLCLKYLLQHYICS